MPHLVETFKVWRDKNFAAKVEDVVRWRAAVFCVDEQGQIQALDRTQPGLPMQKGRAVPCLTITSTTAPHPLFAALNMLDGALAGPACRHRHREFLCFPD
jgi:hypothetical protein